MNRPRMVHPVNTALFDFDMTLVDSSFGISFCLNRLASSFGLPCVEREEVLGTIGYPMDQAMEMLWGRFDPSWIDHYREHLVPLEYERLAPFPGVPETLEELRGRKILMGVISNRKRLVPAVKSSGLGRFFHTLVGMDDVSRPKPDPEPVRVALKRMGRNPQKALMAGDSEVDAITAREAGVTFIGLTTGGRARCDLFAEGALEVLDELAELPGLIAFPTEGVS